MTSSTKPSVLLTGLLALAVILMQEAKAQSPGKCTPFSGKYNLDQVAKIAYAAGFSCNNLIQAIALVGAESGIGLDGLYDPSIKCNQNGDGSLDVGLWQINDYPWRLDQPYDTCQDNSSPTPKTINCLTKTSGNCCSQPSASALEMALNDKKAASYVFSVWMNNKFSFSGRWSAYGNATYLKNLVLATAYVKSRAPYNSCFNCSSVNGQIVCPPQPPVSGATVFGGQMIVSGDPNDKSGSQGVGPLQYVSGNTPLRYSISFSNELTATAAAQKVVVVDQLDPNSEDLASFAIGGISVPDQFVFPPPGPGDFA